MRLNMEIFKSAVFLANEHQSERKNVTNGFRINLRYVFVHANGMPENLALRGFLNFKIWQPQYFIEYKAMSKNFAGINFQYMDI